MLLGAQLLDDVRQQVLDGLCLWFSSHNECVILNGGVGFGPAEMQYSVVVPEEVDFVDAELLGSDFLDETLDNFVAAALNKG